MVVLRARTAGEPQRLSRLEDYVDSLRAVLPELHEEFGVRSLAIFGSRARGEARPESDLDVLVEFDRVPTLLQLARIQNRLTDELGVEVDLVPRDLLRPAVAERVLRELVPI